MKNIIFPILLCAILTGCTCNDSSTIKESNAALNNLSNLILPQETLNNIRILKQNGIISYSKGSEQVIDFNPDHLENMDFETRRTFVFALATYINKYVLAIPKAENWLIIINDMATGKKIAQWTPGFGYKEF